MGGLTWRELCARVWKEINDDDIFNRAAVLGFYFMLALFPLLLFLTALLGLFAQGGTELRNSLLSYLSRVVPVSAYTLIYETVNEITESSGGGKLSFGLLAAIWASSNGMLSIVDTFNEAYHVRESRPWWKSRLVAIALTVALSVLIISALLLVLYGGHIADAVSARFGFGAAFTLAWSVLQWVIVLAFVFLAFALIYYFAPNVHCQALRWVLPGMVVGVALWLIASMLFRLYLRYFDTYSTIYGSLGAVIILMLWFYLTGLAMLIGGEVNSEIEHAAARAGVEDAKLPGEKAPGEKELQGVELRSVAS
jgi:membrane protein